MFTQYPKMLEKLIVFSEKIYVFLQKTPMETENAALKTPQKINQENLENFYLKIRIW